jgi:hypothetical protein
MIDLPDRSCGAALPGAWSGTPALYTSTTTKTDEQGPERHCGDQGPRDLRRRDMADLERIAEASEADAARYLWR